MVRQRTKHLFTRCITAACSTKPQCSFTSCLVTFDALKQAEVLLACLDASSGNVSLDACYFQIQAT